MELIIIFDTLRIIAALAALAVLAMTPYALVRRRMSWHQKARFIGAAVVGCGIIGSYLSTLGTVPPAAWRLIVITIGLIISLVGTAAYLRDTVASAPTRHRR